jgi:hypothetical protein
MNLGNAEIRPNDFSEPLRFSFSDETTIESVIVTGSEPASLQVAMREVDNKTIELQPLLLNSGDKFDLELLVDGQAEQFRVSGRVAGVKDIENLSRSAEPRKPRRRLQYAALAGGAGLAVFLIAFFAAGVAITSLGSGGDTDSSYNGSDLSSGSGSSTPTPPVRDAADAVTTNCTQDAQSLEEVPLASNDGHRIGRLQLFSSSACDTVWGQVDLTEDLVGNTAISTIRPHDGMTTTYETPVGRNGSNFSYSPILSNMLNTQDDCARVKVVASFGKIKVSAETQCRG